MLPSVFEESDVAAVVKQCAYVNKHKDSLRIFNQSYITTVAFIERASKLFEVRVYR